MTWSKAYLGIFMKKTLRRINRSGRMRKKKIVKDKVTLDKWADASDIQEESVKGVMIGLAG